ncbi:Ubiquitin carboxyl-terminal hydrolase isozyme L3 [Gonapodya sp. JEL0774]|nr:Ubiquitin carboxyl-terminal hydrolase isozyme L3 [Gonapodya sp. JEL0774]
MNTYAAKIGVNTDLYHFVDVWSLDHDALAFIPQPVQAVILLFPTTEKYHAFTESQTSQILAAGQTVHPDLYFTRQTIYNACGLYGMLHSLLNTPTPLSLPPDSILAHISRSSEGKSPDERAKVLEQCKELEQVHEGMAREGQTEAPPLESEVLPHYVAFVYKGGHIYEMDGAKPFPINHGPCKEEELLEKAAKEVQAFIDRDPDMTEFSVIALVPNVN